MKKDEAISLLEKTFNSKFDEKQYKVFIKNFFKNIDESDNFSYSGAYIPDDYKDYVKSYKRIGKFVFNDDTALDIIIVNLKKESLLERNRSMQRNFIAKYLKTRGDKDFSLVAYYCDDSEDWRFSFIKKEYASELTDNGKVKIKESFTPAKRFSFLVGKNEPNHTAKNQLLPILQLESDPTLDIIEKAFNIESVTKEFFEKYKNLFLTLLDKIENIVKDNNKIKIEFETKNINISSFAKKLLGQIVFLYFLQKKGWLGIEKNESGDFKQWGSGAKDFLRKLFEKKYINYNNFFNDVLEPLFYEALANERENDYYHQLKCKIPFLNGGLFEPIGNYNWQEVNIPIENSFFEDVFNAFDFYNFTVREDEPLEKEVAVDPEMLGKVFENLLEVKDRKSKGAFYTPREIVHYMCQESLINYLDTEINQVDVAVIKEKPKQENLFSNDQPEQLPLISKGYKEIIKRTDIEFFIKNGDFAKENDFAKIKGTKSYDYSISESIRKNAKFIDKKLANVKICDPAIGSGAFPVGIMTEIVKARDLLSIYISDEKDRNLYNFKRNAIQKSIYGVDLDPSAVDIAKLRLWLSLIVDEEEYKDIKPLPNLDYKIVCANSLLNIEVTILNYKLFDKLEVLKPLFFNESNNKKKKDLKIKIDSLINEITNNNDEFDYKVYFSEVFHYNNGFDIVIGNPPYGVSIKGEYRKKIHNYLGKVPDFEIYYYFIELSKKLLKRGGIKSFIIPNTILFNLYAKQYRLDLFNYWESLEIIDCTNFSLFESATVRNIITLFKRGEKLSKVYYKNTKDVFSFEDLMKKEKNTIDSNVLSLNNNNWGLIFKLEKDVLNLINTIKNNKVPLIKYFSEVSQGLIAYDKYRGQSDEIIKSRAYHYKSFEKNNLKPWLWGEDITKFSVKWNEKEWVDYCDGIANPREKKFFTLERLLVREITNPSIYAGYTKDELYNDPSIIIILKSSLYKIKTLLGILNSKLATYYHFNSSPKATKGAFPKILVNDIKEFPLPNISFETQKPFEIIVDYILFLKSIKLEDSSQKFMPIYFEQILNGMVYELYFEEILKKSEKDILKYLTNLKDINDYKTDEEKLNVITNEFNILEDIKHPVRNNLFSMDSIEEIRIIEGKNK